MKPLVWMATLVLGQLALAASPSASAADSPDPALQVTPHLGPPPKPGAKKARTRQRPVPAKTARYKKSRTEPAEVLTSPPVLPPSAAQVFLIQHSLPERVDPDLAQPMVAKMSAPGTVRAAAKTVVIVPFEPAADIPMEEFLAWAKETAVPVAHAAPRPLPTVQSQERPGASLFASITGWLRDTTQSVPPVELIVMVPVEPAPDLPMEIFTAWASQPEGTHQADVVIELEAFDVTPDLPMASFVEWAKEPTGPTIEEASNTLADQPPAVIEQPAPEPEAFEPTPDLPMEVFTEWAKQPDSPVGAPPESSSPTATLDTAASVDVQTEIEVSEATPDLPMESFVEWAHVASEPVVTPALQATE